MTWCLVLIICAVTFVMLALAVALLDEKERK